MGTWSIKKEKLRFDYMMDTEMSDGSSPDHNDQNLETSGHIR